jgi:small subunit ribosomal protein S16
MALVIRLRQQGRTNRKTYRVVVADEKSRRDGKYIEMLGWYNPCESQNNVKIDEMRLNYWLEKGAQITENVEGLAARVVPEAIIALHARQHAKRIKLAAKRRARRKKASKQSHLVQDGSIKSRAITE